MKKLRFAMIGAGFWSRYQLAAWHELDQAECIAVCDCDRQRAEQLGRAHRIDNCYDDARRMLQEQSLDFVDIVTSVESHAPLTKLAAEAGCSVICQKPMAPSMQIAEEMLAHANAAGVELLIHENWRWQAPLRRIREILASGQLGKVVRARIDYANSFPVFDNQPFLKDLEQFILTDIGTHILDVARFLFGEATELYCQARRLHEDIAGEDVATVIMRMGQGVTVTCNMSYASRWEYDRFPQTMLAIEGTKCGVSLGADFSIKVFGEAGVNEEQVEIPDYRWADPEYALIHSSIVACHRDLLDHLTDHLTGQHNLRPNGKVQQGQGKQGPGKQGPGKQGPGKQGPGKHSAETTGEDNMRSLQLVFAAYQSNREGNVVKFN